MLKGQALAKDVVAPEIQTICTVGRAAGVCEYRLFEHHDRVVLVARARHGGSPRQWPAAMSTRFRPLAEAAVAGGR